MKKRLVIFGSGTFGQSSFEALADDARFEIVAIVSQPARPVGRKQVLTPTAIAAWAEKRGLPVSTPEQLRQQSEVEKILAAFKADLFVVADYGLIVPTNILKLPLMGCLNIHASLLPAWRGASPIAQTILHGEKDTGVTLMVMDAGLDTGPIVQQWSIDLTGQETRPELEQRLSLLAAEHIVEAISEYFDGQIKPEPQENEKKSLAPKITVEDGQATWGSAVVLERKIRAFQPWPGLWTMWNGQRMKILAATVQPGSPLTPPGTIEIDGKRWKISCHDGWLAPSQVQFSGKNPQPAETIPGSYQNFIGSQLA